MPYAIEKQIEGIAYIAPAVSSSYQLVVGNQNWTASVEGTTPNVLDIRSYKLAEGRNMTERDLSSRARVCVIGQTIVDNLFPEGDAVGKTLRINKAPFQVTVSWKPKVNRLAVRIRMTWYTYR